MKEQLVGKRRFICIQNRLKYFILCKNFGICIIIKYFCRILAVPFICTGTNKSGYIVLAFLVFCKISGC